LSFDPSETQDISEKIKYFIDKKPKFDYSSIIKRYSFAKMTEETLKIYMSVLSKD